MNSLLVITLLFFSSSCIAKRSGKDESKINSEPLGNIFDDDQVPPARIHEVRQKQFLDYFLKRKDSLEAWALFSYNGWLNGAGKTKRIFALEDGSLAWEETDTFAELKILKKSKMPVGKTSSDLIASFDSLKHLSNQDDAAADGIQYQFVRAIKAKSGDVLVIQRVFMNNPSAEKNPEHTKLIGTFYIGE